MQVSLRVRVTGFVSSPGVPVPGRNLRLMRGVENSQTGQVLEAGPDSLVLVDFNHWTPLTRVVQSELDWPQINLY